MKKISVFKKYAALLCSAALLVPPITASGAVSYSDVPGGHWAEPFIRQATDAGIISGMGDGTFGLGRQVTRAEFAVMLNRLMGWESVENTDTGTFEDVSPGEWYFNDVETAYAHGALGEGGTAFRPNDSITREEMAVMLVRALGYESLADRVSGCPFADVTANAGYITIAYDFGIINGKDENTFDPAGYALREESAAMMMRLREKVTHRLDTLHGFYAISSWSQRDLAAQMDSVSFGWSRLEYDPAAGVNLNTTSANGNDWVIPDGAEDAVSYLSGNGVSLNLAVMMNTSQTVTMPDGSTTDACRAILLDAENRKAAVEQIAQAAASYEGVTIDFEGMKGEDLKNGLNLFLQELRNLLGNQKLYTAVHPVMKNSAEYYDAYDYRAIGEVSDMVILMAHDYAAQSMDENLRSAGFTTTPVTPFEEIYFALQAITDQATGVQDTEKIALAVSLSSTAAWTLQDGTVTNETAIHPSPETIVKRLNQPDTVISYSEQYRNPYARYRDDTGQEVVLWYEDSRSIQDKISLARMFGVNNLSVWRIGAIPTKTSPNLYYNIWETIGQNR